MSIKLNAWTVNVSTGGLDSYVKLWDTCMFEESGKSSQPQEW